MEVSEGATQSSSIAEKSEEPMEESSARSDDVADQPPVVSEDADTEPAASNVDC